MKRRTVLKLLGVSAAAAAAVPLTKQVLWSAQDFTREDYKEVSVVSPNGKRVWQNWSGLHTATPSAIFVPADEEELAARIAAHKGRLRPVGSGHSFTPLVPNDDMIVDVSRLSGLLRHDTTKQTATFGAGTRLRQAAIMAAEKNLAFPNLPDIDVQTLAGSFSTATHGTGRTLQAMHARIIGLRLITATGEILDITESHPLFYAAQVSLGALGVITQYTLRMQPNYALTKRVTLERTDDVIENLYARAQAHRNFEFFILTGTDYTAVLSHDIHQGALTGRPPSQDDDILTIMRDLRNTLGWFPWARRKAFELAISAYVPESGVAEESTAEYWQLLSTSRPTKFNEMEYHLPEESAQQAIREIADIMNARREAFFPIEFRFTAPDDAWLSPFNDGIRCSIAVHTAAREDYQVLFKDIEPVMRKYGGRPHWGKLHSLAYDDFVKLYPRFGDFIELRKQYDSQGKFLNAHLAKIFGEFS